MTDIYDPHRLVTDVLQLLRDQGVTAELAPGQLGDAVGGAGMLLRSLGVRPALDMIDAFARSADKVWSDDDQSSPSQ